MNPHLCARARNICKFRALRVLLPAVLALSGHSQVIRPTPSDSAAVSTFSVTVRSVVLHASVRRPGGGIVSGLQQRNFQLYEDDQPQSIRGFQPKDIPVVVGLVVDDSGSMRKKQSNVTAAVLSLVRLSNSDDELFVVRFNEHVTFSLSDTKLSSESAAELEKNLLKPSPAGKTALYDAISAALAHILTSTQTRKALVVISDGEDNASKHTLSQTLQTISTSDVTVFAIGLVDEDDGDNYSRALRRIAGASGGEAFLPRESGQIVQVCERIATDIRAQYSISYSPSNQNFNGEYRTVKLSVTTDRGTNLQVRTRPGYIAASDSNPESAATK